MKNAHSVNKHLFLLITLWMIFVSNIKLAIANECETGDINKNIVTTQKQLKEDPKNLKALVLLASCFLLQNNLATANKYLDKALEINSQDVGGLMIKAEIQARNQAWEAAKNIYQQVLILDPGNAPAYLAISNVQMALGNKDAADQAFEQYKILVGSQ